MSLASFCQSMLANCSYLTLTVPSLVNPIDLLHINMPMVMRGLIGTVPILTQEKGRKNVFIFCKNLPVVMYRKFRNVPIFKDIPPICPYFLGFRVGKYARVGQYTWYPFIHLGQEAAMWLKCFAEGLNLQVMVGFEYTIMALPHASMSCYCKLLLTKLASLL